MAARHFLETSAAGVAPVIAAVGTDLGDMSLTAIAEPLANGAWFLGELTKFVHASPQRFLYVIVDASAGGPAGLVAGVPEKWLFRP